MQNQQIQQIKSDRNHQRLISNNAKYSYFFSILKRCPHQIEQAIVPLIATSTSSQNQYNSLFHSHVSKYRLLVKTIKPSHLSAYIAQIPWLNINLVWTFLDMEGQKAKVYYMRHSINLCFIIFQKGCSIYLYKQAQIKQQQLFKKNTKLMFPTNKQFYIPMYYYYLQHFMMSNLQFIYPQTNIFPTPQIYSDSTSLSKPKVQIERETPKNNDLSELYNPQNNKQKTMDLMKTKLIRKKVQKVLDPIEQAQRLKRKLSNRPKTYQTQKKMYMNTNLSDLGIIDEQKRVLRRKRTHARPYENVQQSLLKHQIEWNSQPKNESLDIDQEKHQEQQINSRIQIQKSLKFNEPSEQTSKSDSYKIKYNSKIEHKKLDLIFRKFEQPYNLIQ